MSEPIRMVIQETPLLGFQLGIEDGWQSATSIYGLRDCTVRNDGIDEMRVPIGRREAYLDLAPGEQVSLRTVGAAAKDV